jgi:hypothetical protein
MQVQNWGFTIFCLNKTQALDSHGKYKIHYSGILFWDNKQDSASHTYVVACAKHISILSMLAQITPKNDGTKSD